jgi:hypothetical protein
VSNEVLIHGPHCPKCGFADRWSYYSGSDPDNPDALRCLCEASGAVCGYIYWRRNAPPFTEEEKDTILKNAQALGRESKIQNRAAEVEKMAIAKRARVRAILFAIIAAAGEKVLAIRDWEGLAIEAERADRAIEALTITHGRES